MITNEKDYINLLYRIQDPNRQTTIIKLPKDEPIYHIDLNTRKIETPQFLSVEYDHNAETIYFSVDRYYDNVDLSTMFCVVQYENANPDKKKRGYIYAVPYFDLVTMKEENKMLFQWAIEGPATAFAGTVTFSIKFYRISSREVINGDGSTTQQKFYDYVLNTSPTTSKVLHGLDIQATSENYIYDADTVSAIYQAINTIANTSTLCWIVLDDDYDPNAPIETREDYPESTINKNESITDLIRQ